MKTKLFKTLAATAMSVLAIACAKEPVADNGQQAGVSFEIENPVVISKAGEGTTATQLYYQVFTADGQLIAGLPAQSKPLSSLKTTVTFQLVKDQTYKFIFWAQTPTAGYYSFAGTDDAKDIRTVTANYEGKAANDENFDAFFATESFKVTGPVTKTVTLKRPFAQINIGTKDQLKAGSATAPAIDFTGAKSSVTVTGVPTVFSPLAATPETMLTVPATVTFASAAIPTEPLNVKGTDYNYLAMNYVFAPAEGTVCDLSAEIVLTGREPIQLSSPTTPIKRNWRTNILGSLLTSGVDFNVVVDPSFEGEIPMVTVNTLAELKTAVSNGGIVTLAKDIDVDDAVSIEVEKGKELVLNLNGHKISNSQDIWNDTQNSLISVSGIVTVKGAGKVLAKENDCYTFNVKNGGRLIIEDGDFIGNVSVIQIQEGLCEIKGGTFKLAQTWPSVGNGYDYTINLIDAAGKDGTANAIVTGGSFYKFNPSSNDAENPHKNFVAEGYKSTKVGDYYVVTKEDVTPVASNEGLNAAFNEAVNAGKEITVNLSEGTFNWPDSKDGNNVKFPKTINVVGTSKEDCFVRFSAGSYPEDSDVIFENVTIDNAVGCAYNEGSLAQMVRVKDVTVKNCIIKNQFRILAKGIVNIKNCQFINTNSSGFDGYCLNYYGYDGSTVNVENCTFDTVQKAIVIYSEGHVTNYTLNVKDCQFTASDSSTDKAAVQMHTECGIHGNVTINNCTATGFKANALSPEGLWWEGNNNTKAPTKNFTIKVDGTTVQTAE